MNALAIRLFFSILLFGISHNSVCADPQLEPLRISTEAKPKTEWEIDLHTQKSSGSTYFYLAPRTSLHESNSLLGIFIPFQFGQSKRNHLWFNTGTLYYSGGAGYRRELANTYRNQNWFWGGYITHAYHGAYQLEDSVKNLRSINVGIELGGSRWGQFIINGYKFSNEGLNEPFKQIKVRAWYSAPRFSKLIDNGGVSLKFVSTPKIWDMQFSAIGALTNFYSRMKQGAQYFESEWVPRLGVGVEFNLSSWAHIECRWTLIDKYKPIALIPSFGIKFIGVKPHLAKDTFQGRLKRPSEYYAPVYVFSKVAQDLQAFQSIFRNMSQIQNPGDLQLVHFQDGNIMEPWQKELNQSSSVWEAAGKPIDPAAFESAKSSKQLAQLIEQEKMKLNLMLQAMENDSESEDKEELRRFVEKDQRELDLMLKEIEMKQQKIESTGQQYRLVLASQAEHIGGSDETLDPTTPLRAAQGAQSGQELLTPPSLG